MEKVRAKSPISCEVRPPLGGLRWRPAIVMLSLLAILLLGTFRPARAQPGKITEYRLKTAYLYHFAQFTIWPASAFNDASGVRAPFIIGVLGDDPLGTTLDELARRKTVKGRPIVVRRFKSWKNYQPCHILFLSRTTLPDLRLKAIAATASSPLLLVGESPGFAVRGATVNFYPDVDGTIGFEINIDATKQRKLRVDARVWKLARIVRGPTQPGGED